MGINIGKVSFKNLSGFNGFQQDYNQKSNNSTSLLKSPSLYQYQTQTNSPVQNPIPVNPFPVQQQNFNYTTKNILKDNLAYINAGLALVSLGIASYAIVRSGKAKGLSGNIDSKIGDINSQLGQISDKLTEVSAKNSAMDAKLTSVESIARNNSTNIDNVTNDLTDTKKWYDGYLSSLNDDIVNMQAYKAMVSAPRERNLANLDGIPLLRNLKNDGTPIELSERLKSWLNEAADIFINNKKDKIPQPKPLTKDSTIWSLTSESIPEKEGGLGEVPVQIAKNLTKEFNIDNYLVRPLSLIHGKSKLEKIDGVYKYTYDLDKPKHFEITLDKVAEFSTQAYRNDRIETQPVEVFIGLDPRGFKRLMFKNNDYFTSNGLYTDSQKVSETERYAFFSKAVYEFMKIKADPNSQTFINILNKEKFMEIKTPDAMILNDWHAGSIAPLLRLKAPCEAEMKELSSRAAELFKSMNLININHNLDYQGTSWQHTSEILNTLFDKYAYDIYKHANTGFEYDALKKVLVTDNQVNLANMAACLSNKMKPVSPTYANELAEQLDRSHAMQHLCTIRKSNGSLQGASNGWDRSVNEVSQANIAGFLNAINGDKITLFQTTLRNLSGISDVQRARMEEVLSGKLDAGNFRTKIEQLKEIGSECINNALEAMETKGTTKLREYKSYTHADSTERILLNRRHNKEVFIEYLKSMIEHNKKRGDRLFNIGEYELTDLSHIKPEDLDNTLVLNMGVRFVSQKGVDVACNAIRRVMNEWTSKYPGKPRPVIVIGGADGEGGNIRKIAENLKKELGYDLGKQLVWQDGYTANNIFQAGSDFTLYSSHFEPDGAKWESLYKGTPVVCTRVGGHVDSVKDGINGFLTGRTVPQIKSLTGTDYNYYLNELSNDFTDAIYKAADTFYDKQAYTNMVRNAIDGDQSWVIKNETGDIVGGALLGHMKDLGFNLSDFSKIKTTK